MAVRPVDFHGALVADLPRGRLETRDRRRLIALPSEWLASLLVRAPGDDVAPLGGTLASALEPDARSALEPGGEPTPDEAAYAISVALATRGLGVVLFERWGDALVLVWRDAPGEGEVWDELLAATVASLLGTLTGLALTAAPVGRERDELRVLFGSDIVCELARARARSGDGLPEILTRLERGAEAP